MSDLISPTIRRSIQESYVGFAVLGQIESDFKDAGLDRRQLPSNRFVSGQRRTLVEEYYESVDWTSAYDVKKVLIAWESHVFRLSVDSRDVWKAEAKRVIQLLIEKGLGYDGRRITLNLPGGDIEELVDRQMGIDVSQVRANISRIRGAVDTDPALAIGASKELVEACCKAILVELDGESGSKLDLPDLIKIVAKTLDLVPEGVPDSKKGAASIRRVLGSLANIVNGIAELRNRYGSGHGQAPSTKGLLPRHARLCSGAASTLALFLIETARERKGGA